MKNLYADLDGYRPVPISPRTTGNANIVGNVIFGGVAGAGIDALSGRAVRYENVIKIEFAQEAEK